MIKVMDLASTAQIGNPAIRQLVEERINDLGDEAFDATEIGYFLVVEAIDTIEAIQKQVGFNVLKNRFTGIRFDATGFTPSFEFVEEFASCFDMVLVISNDGYGVELFVPKTDGVDADLLAMCRMYAFKEVEP